MDDAAYALGAWLTSDSDIRTFILTVFGVSNFAPYIPGEHGHCENVTRLRREEDHSFAVEVGAEHSFFDILEAPLRGRSSICDIFVSPDEATGDPVCGKLELELRNFLSALKPDRLLAPLCIGGHIDHWIVRFAAMKYAIEFGCKLMYYEDLPYAGELEDSSLDLVLDVLANDLQPMLTTTEGLDRKVQLLRGYPSQICQSDIRNVIHQFDRVGGERCWLLNYPRDKEARK